MTRTYDIRFSIDSLRGTVETTTIVHAESARAAKAILVDEHPTASVISVEPRIES